MIIQIFSYSSHRIRFSQKETVCIICIIRHIILETQLYLISARGLPITLPQTQVPYPGLSCSPRLHEPTFRRCVEEAGLNKFLFEFANLREQDSWVHMSQPEEATAKAKDLTRMAVAKARLLEPLEATKVAFSFLGGL